MDTYTDNLARESQMHRTIENISRRIFGQPTIDQNDNHGNHQIDDILSCSNGEIVNISYSDTFRDTFSLIAHAELIERGADGLGATYSLGDLPSPLQTRCEAAAEEHLR